MALKSLETGAIIAGVAFVGYLAYEFLKPKEDDGTLIADLSEVDLPLDDDVTYCTIDGQQVATSLVVSTGIVLKAGVHTFALHVDDGTGEYQMMIQSQFQIQPRVRTRLVVHSDFGTEEVYEEIL